MDSKHFIGDLPTGLAVDLACIMHRDIVESIPFLQVNYIKVLFG